MIQDLRQTQIAGVWIQGPYSLTIWFTVTTITATIHAVQHSEQVSHFILCIHHILNVDSAVCFLLLENKKLLLFLP